MAWVRTSLTQAKEKAVFCQKAKIICNRQKVTVLGEIRKRSVFQSEINVWLFMTALKLPRSLNWLQWNAERERERERESEIKKKNQQIGQHGGERERYK